MKTISMSFLRLACGAALIGALANAQDDPEAALKQKREEKLAKAVWQKADWTFDYDAARARAKKDGKLIFTYFTRSYSG